MLLTEQVKEHFMALKQIFAKNNKSRSFVEFLPEISCISFAYYIYVAAVFSFTVLIAIRICFVKAFDPCVDLQYLVASNIGVDQVVSDIRHRQGSGELSFHLHCADSAGHGSEGFEHIVSKLFD